MKIIFCSIFVIFIFSPLLSKAEYDKETLRNEIESQYPFIEPYVGMDICISLSHGANMNGKLIYLSENEITIKNSSGITATYAISDLSQSTIVFLFRDKYEAALDYEVEKRIYEMEEQKLKAELDAEKGKLRFSGDAFFGVIIGRGFPANIAHGECDTAGSRKVCQFNPLPENSFKQDGWIYNAHLLNDGTIYRIVASKEIKDRFPLEFIKAGEIYQERYKMRLSSSRFTTQLREDIPRNSLARRGGMSGIETLDHQASIHELEDIYKKGMSGSIIIESGEYTISMTMMAPIVYDSRIRQSGYVNITITSKIGEKIEKSEKENAELNRRENILNSVSGI